VNEALKLLHSSSQTGKVPKMAMNGTGGSGFNKFRAVISEIQSLLPLYTRWKEYEISESDPAESKVDIRTTRLALDPYTFKDFAEETVNWQEFTEKVYKEGISQYYASVSIIHLYEEHTGELVREFENKVLRPNFNSEVADVILTTIHAGTYYFLEKKSGS